jgi:molecular chaperone GrpE
MTDRFDQDEAVDAGACSASGDAAGESGQLETLQKLVLALEEKTREAAEERERYLRTYADFENYRKRMQRDLLEFRKYANEQLLQELLSVVDHLALALQHAAEGAETNAGLRQGVELVYKQFIDVLEKFGVKPFESEGEPFDPAKHDAVMQDASSELPPNTVLRAFQDGYLYHDKILRHAKVSVSTKAAESAPDGEFDPDPEAPGVENEPGETAEQDGEEEQD